MINELKSRFKTGGDLCQINMSINQNNCSSFDAFKPKLISGADFLI